MPTKVILEALAQGVSQSELAVRYGNAAVLAAARVHAKRQAAERAKLTKDVEAVLLPALDAQAALEAHRVPSRAWAVRRRAPQRRDSRRTSTARHSPVRSAKKASSSSSRDEGGGEPEPPGGLDGEVEPRLVHVSQYLIEPWPLIYHGRRCGLRHALHYLADPNLRGWPPPPGVREQLAQLLELDTALWVALAAFSTGGE
jgi:hypothetical protein